MSRSGIATIICGLIVVPESRESTRHKFDLPGLALLASSMFCLVFAVIHSETWGWTSSGVLGLLGASAVLAAAFVLVERRVTAPLVPIPLLATRSIALGIVTLLLNFFALYGVLFFVSLYLQNGGRASTRSRRACAAPAAHRDLLGHIAVRRQNHHALGARLPITAGLGLTTASLLGMLDLSQTSSFLVLCPSSWDGLGVALVVVASTEAIIAERAGRRAGVAGGLQGISIQLGGVLGASILGSILAAWVTKVLPGLLGDQGVPLAFPPRRRTVRSGQPGPRARGGATLAGVGDRGEPSGLHLGPARRVARRGSSDIRRDDLRPVCKRKLQLPDPGRSQPRPRSERAICEPPAVLCCWHLPTLGTRFRRFADACLRVRVPDRAFRASRPAAAWPMPRHPSTAPTATKTHPPPVGLRFRRSGVDGRRRLVLAATTGGCGAGCACAS